MTALPHISGGAYIIVAARRKVLSPSAGHFVMPVNEFRRVLLISVDSRRLFGYLLRDEDLLLC